MRGAARAIEAWHEDGADLVLGGHIHLPGVLPLRPAPAPLWAAKAGTAVSTQVRHATHNSVSELLCGPSGPTRWPIAPRRPAHSDGVAAFGGEQQPSCSVRFWDWLPGQRDFVPRPEVELPLASPVLQRQRST